MQKKITLSIASLFLCFTALFATNYTVNFGSFYYSPDTLQLIVGDQVTWAGSFTSHPLASTSVPFGAASFSSSVGTSYSYTVTVPGIYNYECSIHGFKGVLIVSSVSGITSLELTPKIELTPNPATTSVTISIENPERVLTPFGVTPAVTVTDITGRVVLQSEIRNSKFEINTALFANGAYFVTLGNTTQKLIINH